MDPMVHLRAEEMKTRNKGPEECLMMKESERNMKTEGP